MSVRPGSAGLRFLVPEVVQTSAMDCGPASLKCLLEGFGIPVSYGRLREACQTDVDGTSIDTMEEIALQLGLDAEQIMLPCDYVLLPEARALPAIAVITLPNGNTHFVVAWRCHRGFVQVMDPATGRRWPTKRSFLSELYQHTRRVSAADWREWAGSSEFLQPLHRRLAGLGLHGLEIDRLLADAASDKSWRSFASLHAAANLANLMIVSRALRRGHEAGRLLAALFERSLREADGTPATVPDVHWSVRPVAEVNGGEEQLLLRGAVLVRALGRRPEASQSSLPKAESQGPISDELLDAMDESVVAPARSLFAFLRADGLLNPITLVNALLMAAGGVIFEAVLLREILDLGLDLKLVDQRIIAIAAIATFLGAILVLDLAIAGGVLRLGRHLELRLRIAFLRKIPRLGERYFHSRLTSDMAERSHSLHNLRLLPEDGEQFLRSTLELLLTAVGITVLDPASGPFAFIAAASAILIPASAQPLLAERDLRVRSHVGALGRFYLDAMSGLVAIRAHGAEPALGRLHRNLVTEWRRARFSLLRAILGVEGLQALIGFGLAGWLLLNHLSRTGDAGGGLLLVYWALNLPLLGQEIALAARLYPYHRSVTLRLLEPLGAPEENSDHAAAIDSPSLSRPEHKTLQAPLSLSSDPSIGMAIRMENVTIRAGGHPILEAINLEIEAGSHVALVGPSGAGKSTLVGILLGWTRPVIGEVYVDGVPLRTEQLADLRRHIAWVDPTVQLWNRSLLDNLAYGSPDAGRLNVGDAINDANLRDVLKGLPEGLQTTLGENGALVSGGEGQRVRLGRAMLRPAVRLAILDEPFRGLDRTVRRELLAQTRRIWRSITLLCITHDISDTLAFDRVLVVEQGHVVEQGCPAQLAQLKNSRHRAMLDAEASTRDAIWASSTWRRLRLDQGRLREHSPGENRR